MATGATEPTPEELWQAPIVFAQEPHEVPAAGSITITFEEFHRIADPTDVGVLAFWRGMEADGEQPSVNALWTAMARQGVHDDDGQPVRLETVQASVDRLMAIGSITAGGESQ